MTIICALHDPEQGCTWIGSDTQCGGTDINFPSHPKWVVNGIWAAGIAGDYRAHLLIQEASEVLARGSPHLICNGIRDVFLDDGFEPARDKDSAGFQHFGQNIILASPAGIWSVDTCLAAALVKEPFFADGSGWELAQGAFFAMRKHSTLAPRDVVETAIMAAMDVDGRCGGEVWMHKLEKT